jgi:aerobic-type carbon monoxide dehydrogenase small subunit (CoxS/CutS family)
LQIRITVNGKAFEVEAPAGETLVEVLRRLGFKSVKDGCYTGTCGGCTVLLDGRPVASCIMLAVQADGASIVTLEGLADGDELHPVQEAFMEANAPQCGFCSPGMMLTAVSLLRQNANPTRDEIREAIAGNTCRCSGYVRVVDAIELAARKMRGSGGK